MSETAQNPYRLLTPGPVPLHPEVQRLLSEPMIHHRTPDFESCLKRVMHGLKEVFATSEMVFMHTSTGSGAMESAIVNTLSAGDEVLCIVSGKFGERWAEMCKTYGVKVHALEVSWGEAVKVSQIAEAFQQHPNIKAVLTQACETSTATIHPIKEIAEFMRGKSNAILMVDAITAVGAMPLEMDAWGLDVVVGGSQKAFMLPAGLSFIALSKKAWEFTKTSTLPKFYFDLRLEKKSLEKGETHFSAVVPTVRALDKAIEHLTGEQKSRTLFRIQNLASATRAAAPHLGLKVFSKAPSPSVTALVTPADVDSQKLRDHIERKYNLTLAGGQDHLKGKILRIGHIGYITNDDMFEAIEIIYQALNDFAREGRGGRELSEAELSLALSELAKVIV